jgi:excisionase family DNA binding protein
MADLIDEQWLSPAQAALQLHLTPQRIRQLVDTGRLGAVKTPLGRLVKAADVAALAAERGQPSPPTARGAV